MTETRVVEQTVVSQVTVTEDEVTVVALEEGATGPAGPAGPAGPPGVAGDPGIEVGPVAPSDTDILWADTSEPGDAVVPVGGASGQVLAKASATDYDTEWSSGPLALTQMPALGTTNRTSSDVYGWPLCLRTFGSTQSRTANRLYFHTAAFPSAVVLQRIRMQIHIAAASADQLARLGVYATNDSMQPTSLIEDFGTVDISSTGIKAITGIGRSLDAGVYAFVYVLQEDCTTSYTSFTGFGRIENNLASNDFSQQSDRPYAPFTFGVLPSTFPSGTTWEANTGATPQTHLQLGWSLA